MAILYYNNAVLDGDWNNIDNWWTDSGYLYPAPVLPANGDFLYVDAEVTAGASTLITPDLCVVGWLNNGSFGVDLTNVGGVLALYGASVCTVTSASYMQCYADSYFAGTLTGYAEFYGGSTNGGTITGSADFYESSVNDGAVGDAMFTGSTSNNGTVNGNAVFYETAYSSYTSTIQGSSTQFGMSYSAALVYGMVTVRDMASFAGSCDNCNAYDEASIATGGSITYVLNLYNASKIDSAYASLINAYDNSFIFNPLCGSASLHDSAGCVNVLPYNFVTFYSISSLVNSIDLSSAFSQRVIDMSYMPTLNFPFADILGAGMLIS